MIPAQPGSPPLQFVPRELSTGQSIDLDTGQLNPTEGTDLTYGASPSAQLSVPKSGRIATVAPPADATSVVAQCRSTTPSPGPLPITDLKPGSVLCVRTDSQRNVVVYVGAPPTDTDKVLRAFYLTLPQ